MAVIQTIRDKYAKLAGGVIVLALVGFILMDATSGRGGGLFKKSTTIGKVNGESIDYMEYENAVSMREMEMKRQNANLDETTQGYVRDQVWNQLVNDKILADINEKLGITVTKAELNDLLTGANPDPIVKQSFTNPETGIFNPSEAASAIAQIKKDPERRADWEAFESDLVKRRYSAKFNALIAGAIYVPKFVLDDQHDARGSIANIDYVKLPYALIPDDKAPVSDDDITAFMKAHESMFQIKTASRSIEYVSFHAVPSAEDSAALFSSLEKLKQAFAESTDDAAFIDHNSISPAPIGYYSKEQLAGLPNVDELTAAPVNSIVGPFFDGRNFTLAKIEERKSMPDSVKVRHILVKTASGNKPELSDELAKARIDSAVALLRAGMPFDSVVVKYSDDYQPQSSNTGGEYEFTLAQKGGISKEFGDFAFEGKTGTHTIVKVSNDAYSGYHYIEILSQSAAVPVNKIAFVSKEFNLSDATSNTIYSKATQFATAATNAAAFEKQAKADGLQLMPVDGINENSTVINGLGASKTLVKWASGAKVGDISPIITIGDQHVIAKLNGITPIGLIGITDQNRPALESYVRKEKKAKLLMEKTKGKTSLESIAQAEGQQVAAADSVSFIQGYINGLGNEPKVVGYSFCKAFKENTVSPGIAGFDGLYYIVLKGRTAIAQPEDRNLHIERQMLEYNLKSNAANMITNNLKEVYKVEDKRNKFF